MGPGHDRQHWKEHTLALVSLLVALEGAYISISVITSRRNAWGWVEAC